MQIADDEVIQDVSIDLDNLNMEVVDHLRRYFKWGKLHQAASTLESQAKHRVDLLNSEFKHETAVLDHRMRRELMSDKKPTEKQVASAVMRADTYKQKEEELWEAKRELIEVEHTAGMLRLLERIFSKRTDLLIMLGYSERRERNSDFDIKGSEQQQIEQMEAQTKQILERKRREKELR